VALILPTVSETLGRLAEALRQGFAAAAEAGGREVPPIVTTAGDNEGPALLAACRDAVARGAVLVVAAMTRDGAGTLARSDCARTLVLALNEPGAGNPPNVFSLSLSLDHEARQVALMAVADGWRNAIVITSPSALSKRVQEAFEREWTRAAGELRARIAYSGAAGEPEAIRETIAKLPGADMVFLALDQQQARAVRPYVTGALPVYATSMSINPRAEAIVNVDLQDVRYVEMPWFVQPDHSAVMVYPTPRHLSVDEERLYAYGIDALRLALQILRGDRRSPLDGVTGRITLDGVNAFSRTLVPAEVEGGRVIPRRSP
jgi:outer membrane PBP1 activator LpoA protein